MALYWFTIFAVGLFGFGAGSMIYEEEFDGTSLNTNDWHIDVWPQSHNNELQYYTDRSENLYVEDGHLVIKPLRENYGGKMWTSGRINSNFAWKYGRVEVRAKLTEGYGLWPAIWMMPRDSVYGGWPESGEIDICEARGEYPDEIQSTIHFGDTPCCDTHQWETCGDMIIDGTIDAYHVYTLDWTPTALVYSLDGKPYYTQNIDRVIGPMYSSKGTPFDQYFFLILNVAVGGHYVNDPSPNTQWNYPDAEMWVDYVRVYPLEDISTYQCATTATSGYGEICGNVEWACYNQFYADVSAQCTPELLNCCSYYDCDLLTVKSLATNVYASYDSQVNSADSCDFGGTAEKQWVLNNPEETYAAFPQCRIKDTASPDEICGSLQWVCGPDNTYADVSTECDSVSYLLTCCAAGASTCNEVELRSGAEYVFNAYYQLIPSSTSCDFGGICYLSGVQMPIYAQDGYGA